MSGHTDAELLIATQIAYLNIETNGHPVNVSDWIRAQKAALESARRAGTINAEGKAQLNTINHIYEMLSQSEYSGIDLSRWNVIDSCNRNTRGGADQSGMYGSLIDTGDGEAIIGFRGSESYDRTRAVQDWGEADLGLHNSYETRQQQDAEEYIERLHREYGDQYESFDVTGHSLGGNLAEHAAVNAPDGMRGKIGRCVNFDGPGFSEEYIATHAPQIASMSGKVDHFTWSAIGGLLLPLPGSHYKVVDAKTPSGHGEFMDQFHRHDTANVRIVDGHVVEGERDPMARGFEVASKPFELLDDPFVPSALRLVLGIWIIAGAFAYAGAYDLYHDLTDARAEFVTDTMALYEAAEQLGSTGSAARGIAEEIRLVTEGLDFYSPSALVCRLRLRSIARSIENDSVTAYALSSALSECADEYISSDRYAAGHLA